MKRIILTLVPLMFLTALVLSACSGDSLAGTSWTLVSYGDPSNLTAAVSGVDTSLVFGSDVQVSGNMGCNGFGGDYQIKNGQIVFGNIISTMMACEEPRMSQETATFGLMSGAVDYSTNGNTLTLTSADGSRVMNLTKK